MTIRAPRIAAIALVSLPLSGCLGAIMGGTLPAVTNNWLLPSVMSSTDVAAGCAAGEALGSLVSAFRGTNKNAARAGIIPLMSAGMCVEDVVREAQLDRARALFEGDAPRAKDARTREKRAHLLAAQRYAAAFEVLSTEYGLPGDDGECPKLRKQSDEMTYLLGLSSGLLAVIHNAGADSSAGVSLSVSNGVVRAAACLDNETWWGVPDALQAAVWALLPGAPADKDPWAMFDASIAIGQTAGVRLSSSFKVQSAATSGNEELLRQSIIDHAASLATPADGQWQMLDTYASSIVLHESDRLWTSSEGFRTPFNALGTFPQADGAPEEVFEDLDDLLGDLVDEPATEAPAP